MTTDSMQSILNALGVTETTLSPWEQDQLDREGYLLIPGLVPPALCIQVCARMEELWQDEGDRAGLEVDQQPGTRRLADLVNKGEIFDHIWLNPKVLAAAWHLIGASFKLFSLNARDALPGQGHQGLHADWGPRSADEPCRVVNSIWMMDPFTEATGATRIIPGSHRISGQVQDYVADVESFHPNQQLALGSPGTVMIYNAHAWHGGTRNLTESHRRAVHCAYVDRRYPQQTDQRLYLRQATQRRLSSAARYILDVE